MEDRGGGGGPGCGAASVIRRPVTAARIAATREEGLALQPAGALGALNITVEPRVIAKAPTIPPGIF